jgi:ethanolamine utilization protein EutA
VCEDVIDPAKLAVAIRNHLTAFDVQAGEREVALAFRWTGEPSYERIVAFAQGIKRGMADAIVQKLPLFVMLDGDVAHTLGALMREELDIESELLVIDGVVLWDFDYIDLGRIRMPSNTVPVTIKSLVFSEDPRLPHGHAHLRHHHDHDHDHRHAHDHGPHTHHHEHAHSHDHDHRHEHAHPHGTARGQKRGS